MILTPHIAGSTAEAQEAVGIQIAAQVREYLKLGVVQNAVNLPSLSHEEYVELSPYIDMAARLGAFLSATADGNVESIAHCLSRAAGAGQDGPGAQRGDRRRAGAFRECEPHQRGRGGGGARHPAARIEDGKRRRGGRDVTLHTRGGETTATATVLHGRSPRLLASDGIDIEVPLHGTLIAIRNHDVPGVIGRVGTVLGEHQVNIANFALGRGAEAAAKDGAAGRSP